MDIVVSHASAFLFWRRFTGNITSLKTAKMPKPAPATSKGLPESVRAELAKLGIYPTPQHPVNLLFATAGARSKSAAVRAHTCSTELPAKSLLRVAPHVLVVSPALCFAQLADVLSMPRLLLAGCELCGRFAIPDASSPEETAGHLPSRAPLTSAAAIARYVNALPGRPGGETARRAAGLLLDDAASPWEARLALLLCLPAAYGGYGLPAPTLNRAITLNAAARELYPYDACEADISWENTTFDLEYNGAESHADRTAQDIARTAALQAQGYDVMTLTHAQLENADAFDAVARAVAGKIGHRIRIRREDFPARRADLRAQLGL